YPRRTRCRGRARRHGPWSGWPAARRGRGRGILAVLVDLLTCGGPRKYRELKAVVAAEPLAVPAGSAVKGAVDAGPTQEEVEVELPGAADAAVNLQALLGHFHRLLPDKGLGHAGHLGGVLALLGHHPGQGRGTGATGFQRQRLVGHDVLEGLEGADGPAKGDALAGVVHHGRSEEHTSEL